MYVSVDAFQSHAIDTMQFMEEQELCTNRFGWVRWGDVVIELWGKGKNKSRL